MILLVVAALVLVVVGLLAVLVTVNGSRRVDRPAGLDLIGDYSAKGPPSTTDLEPSYTALTWPTMPWHVGHDPRASLFSP